MSRARTLMIQGTASHVGKSRVVAGLCRWFARRGVRVAPFKAQNMSLNSAVTADGREIGRSTAFQAEACGVEPEAAMNPILLKPLGAGRCQVIVKGLPHHTACGHASEADTRLALEVVRECLDDLRRRYELVILEGMGSPAEINLRSRDAANGAAAELADAPVLLVGDIERGGVFAALAGTLELLPPPERARVRGLIINKYHGDPSVLQPGLDELERRYGVPTLGILPWLPDLCADEEDSVFLSTLGCRNSPGGQLEIVVPRLPGISNFTDLAPLEAEPAVHVRYLDSASDWGRPAVVILPGSRTVAADLRWLRAQGLADRIIEHARQGRMLVGLCGGYQMLGLAVHDPHGLEGPPGSTERGLGLLHVDTWLEPEKRLTRVTGVCRLPGLEEVPVGGYEIHHGASRRESGGPAFELSPRDSGEPVPDGAREGAVWGTYLHGLFDEDPFRSAFLRKLGAASAPSPDRTLLFDRLADWVGDSLRMDAVLELVGVSLGDQIR